MDLEKRLSKAKTGLILEHPFVGTIAMNMPFIITDEVPTAATNGKHVLFNPDFCGKFTDDELKFVVAHECFHPMLEHIYRLHEREHQRWNQAGDYVINKMLVDEHIGTMPEGCLHDDTVWNAGGGTTDGIYNYLPPTPEDGGGNGYGKPLDDCQQAEGSAADREQAKAEMKVKVAQAAQAAKMMGNLSAGMERLVGEILTPKVNWTDVLRRFVVRAKNDVRTFARPNRRFLSHGMYLPSISGEVMGELVLGIDCSGSIRQAELDQFGAEGLAIWQDHSPAAIHVVYFDSKVCHYDHFPRGGDEFALAPHGGGGTAFSPIFRYIEDNDITPVACVVLTDLYCNDFGPQPDYPVLWVTNGTTMAQWGEVVLM